MLTTLRAETIERDGAPETIIYMAGRFTCNKLDRDPPTETEQAFKTLVASVPKNQKLRFNMSDVSYIDSQGIGALVDTTYSRNSVTLEGLQRRPARLLKIVHLDTAFKIA